MVPLQGARQSIPCPADRPTGAQAARHTLHAHARLCPSAQVEPPLPCTKSTCQSHRQAASRPSRGRVASLLAVTATRSRRGASRPPPLPIPPHTSPYLPIPQEPERRLSASTLLDHPFVTAHSSPERRRGALLPLPTERLVPCNRAARALQQRGSRRAVSGALLPLATERLAAPPKPIGAGEASRLAAAEMGLPVPSSESGSGSASRPDRTLFRAAPAAVAAAGEAESGGTLGLDATVRLDGNEPWRSAPSPSAHLTRPAAARAAVSAGGGGRVSPVPVVSPSGPLSLCLAGGAAPCG